MKKASVDTYSKFYEGLAHLFYAVASADNIVRNEEKKMLHRMVKEDWLDLEDSSDVFDTDSAFAIESIFDYLDDKGVSSEDAFKVFESYFRTNRDLFDEDVITRIIHTTHRIASSFHQKNKSEYTVLTKIHFLLGHANAAH